MDDLFDIFLRENNELFARLTNNLVGSNKSNLFLLQNDYSILEVSIVEEIKNKLNINVNKIEARNISERNLCSWIHENYGSGCEISAVSGIRDLVDTLPSIISEIQNNNRTNHSVIVFSDSLSCNLFRERYSSLYLQCIHENISCSTEFLSTYISYISDEIFKILFDSGSDRFLGDLQKNILENIDLKKTSEITNALDRLENEKKSSNELLGKIYFINGLLCCNGHESIIKNYNLSIENLRISNSRLLEAIVEFYAGIRYRDYAEENNRNYLNSYEQAREHFSRSINIFENQERIDLVIKFINGLCDSFQRLEDWIVLKSKCESIIDIINSSSILSDAKWSMELRLSSLYGFVSLSEVNLNNGSIEAARIYSSNALALINSAINGISSTRSNQGLSSYEKDRLNWVKICRKPWYSYSRALAETALNEYEDALIHLEEARKCAHSKMPFGFDTRLYLLILKQFQEINYELKKYDEAYEYKLQGLSIKQQYGLCGFIGSGQISAEINKSQSTTDDEYLNSIATEIQASERIEFVERFASALKNKLSDFLVLYGQSGTGKSSLIKAGLIPYLSNKKLENRNVIAILFQSNYLNWVKGIGETIVKSIRELGDNWSYTQYYIPEVLEKLRELSNKYSVVLYLDNFEDFYLSTNSIYERENLYHFFIQCMNIQHLTIVISIQDNYLHNLLEIPREHSNLNQNIDILSEEHLLYLKPLSKHQAHCVISNLTKFSIRPFQDMLTNELVKNLAHGNGTINPIELQILCKTIEEDEVYQVETYSYLGSKSHFISKYIDQVIQDCGSDNYNKTRSLVFRMIDKKNERIFKTISELEILTESRTDQEKHNLNIILSILIKAGILRKIEKDSNILYQVTNDYIAGLLKDQFGYELQRELYNASAEKAHADVLHLIEKSNGAYSSNKYIESLLLAVNAAQSFQDFTQNFKAVSASFSYEISKYKIIFLLCKCLYYSNANEVNRLQNHSGKVNSVCFNTSGDLLLSASFDSSFCLWHIDGAYLQKNDTHDDWVNYATFSPNNRYIASCSNDNSIKIWNLQGYSETKKRYTIEHYSTCNGHQRGINSIEFSSDSKLLVSASGDGTIILWNIDGSILKRYSGHRGAVNCIKFTADMKYFISGGCDNQIYIWDINESTPIRGINAHSDFINTIDISPDGKYILSGSTDRTIRLWECPTFTLLHQSHPRLLHEYHHHSKWVSCVVFAQDLNSFYSSSGDKKICVTRIDDGKTIKTIDAHSNDVRSIAKNIKYEILASCSDDFTIKLWDVSTPLEAHPSPIRDVIFSPNSEIVATCCDSGLIKIWSNSGVLVHSINLHQSNPVRSISFSSDSKNIASVSDSNRLLYCSTLGDIIFSYVVPLGKHLGKKIHFTSLAISPDNTIIAAGNSHGLIQIFNIEGHLLHEFPAHTDWINDLIFSHDSHMLISAGSDNSIKVWTKSDLWSSNDEWHYPRISQHKLLGHEHSINSIALTSNSTYLVSGSRDCSIIVWSMSNFEQIDRKFIHSDNINMVDFSPDGNFIFSASSDKRVKVYQYDGTQIGEHIVDYEGHIAWLSCVQVSNDFSRIAISTGDGLLTITSLEFQDLLVEGIKRTQGYCMNDQLYELERLDA